MDLKELILEMKDTSELMLDLAYSALLFNNREIAEEVYYLEERIDILNSKVEELVITQVSRDKPVAALTYIRLASSIEAIADSAREIADVVLRDIEPHPILTESIKESEVMITMMKVSPRSILSKQKLGKIRLASETGMWVIAVRRKNKMIFGPDEFTTIYPGDILIVRGPANSIPHVKKLAAGKTKKL